MRLTTTLALLRHHQACADRYGHLAKRLGGVRRYGRDRAIPLSRILAVNGFDDALWALRAVPETQVAARDRLVRLLACDYAEHVLPVWVAWAPDDRRPHETIATARRYVMGRATEAELDAAESAARSALGAARSALDAAWSAAESAAWSAAESAARSAAESAARSAERAWQTERLRLALSGGSR